MLTVEFDQGARLDTSRVRDRRGMGRAAIPIGVGGGGIVAVIVAVIALLTGGGGGSPFGALDDTQLGAGATSPEVQQNCQSGADANQRDDCRVVAVVNSLDAYWSKATQGTSVAYRPPYINFFTGGIQTGCGSASSAVGPFYCPADEQVYIDLGFFDELRSRFGAQGGPLAEAYVIGHEYGHHVQHLVGIDRQVQSGDTGPSSGAVRLELQADCFAGVWAANAGNTEPVANITEADVATALDAAAAIGDDRIQEAATGRVTPESWTHGSSEQRQQAFVKGFRGGNPNACPF